MYLHEDQRMTFFGCNLWQVDFPDREQTCAPCNWTTREVLEDEIFLTEKKMFPSHFLHAHLVLSHLLNIFSLGHAIFSLMLSTKPQWTLCVSHSHVRLFVTSWTVACQASLSMDFYRQEYWSGLPFPSPGDLPNPGIELVSLQLQADSLLSESRGKPKVSGP